MTEQEKIARDFTNGTLTGYIGPGTTFAGEATCRGMLRIDGRLIGSFNSPEGMVIVGDGGEIEANALLIIGNVEIFGVVHGDIQATHSIKIGRSGKVFGNIQTPQITVEPGATFEGSCKMTAKSELVVANAQTGAGAGDAPVN